jgi:prophage antirepressor-like protein
MERSDPRAIQLAFESTPVLALNIGGYPWFFATDVCGILKLKCISTAVKKLNPDEKGFAVRQTNRGPQTLLVVSESGLYAIVLRTRKGGNPGTLEHRFRRWVTQEAIPSVRAFGLQPSY